ncbi:MAG: hypothetical protein AB1762_19000 [Gemmatimonadota bacterium]
MLRRDFSGEWTLNTHRTKLQVAQLANLDSAILRIEHRDPQFRLSRRFVLRGEEHTVSFELTADGKEVASGAGDQQRFSRLTWDADTLVFSTRFASPSGESLNVVRYTLTNDRRTLEARERFRSRDLNYDNYWVFERSSQ